MDVNKTKYINILRSSKTKRKFRAWFRFRSISKCYRIIILYTILYNSEFVNNWLFKTR